MNPVIFLNFKTYEEATGEKALNLARVAQEVFETGVKIVLVVQVADIRMVSKAVSIPVFAQHIDPVEFGSNTGKILPQTIKEAGAIGTIINHAENKQSNEVIEKAVKKAKASDLQIMVCAENIERAKEVAFFSPDFIAVEPPELIGGNVSVSTSNPNLILDSVKEIKKINSNINVIAGAGIKTAQDVKKSIELGTVGVFVASGVVKATNQKKALQELAVGLK